MRHTLILFALGLMSATLSSGQTPPETKVPCIPGENTPLEYGVHTADCEITTPTEIDFFTFPATADETVRFLLSTRFPDFVDLDPVIEIRDPFNNPVPGQGCTNNCWLDFERTLTETGTYQIRVFDQAYNSTGPYILQLERILPLPWATGLPYASTRFYQLDPITDLDWITFPARAGTEFRLIAVTPTPSLDLWMHIRQPDGTIIHSNNCSGSSTGGCYFQSDINPAQSGFHYLEFHDGGYDEIGEIELISHCLFGSCPLGYYILDLAFDSPTEAFWSPVSDPDATYDVVRGDLNLMRATGGDFSTSTSECLSTGNILAFAEVLDDPDPGAGHFLLARAVHQEIGVGSYDSTLPGQLSQMGGRDVGNHGVNLSQYACPPFGSGIAGSFTPSNPNPGSNTVNMNEHTVADDMVTTSVNVTDALNVYAANLTVTFDPSVAVYESLTAGSLLEQGGTATDYQIVETRPGELAVGATRLSSSGTNAVGTVPLLRLTFRVVQVSESTVAISGQLLDDSVPPESIPGIAWFGGTLIGE